MLELRPYQQAGVDRYLATHEPHRFFFSWPMSAGKTYGTLGVLRDLKMPRRVLFIVPAMVRPVWVRLVSECFPEQLLGSVQMGRARKSGTKKALAERDSAYAAPWQIVSYDLVSEVNLEPWDMVILDEVHNLRNPLSAQSKAIGRIFAANPDVHALGLSGTMIPNEALQIWNPLNTFFPGRFGEPTRTGDVSWQFKNRYCFMEMRHGHPHHYGLRPEARERLRAEVEQVSHRVVEEDFAEYLPELMVEPVYAEVRDRLKFAAEWAAQVPPEIQRFGVFTYEVELAENIHKLLLQRYPGHLVTLITGQTPVERRDLLLKQCRETDKVILVGTIGALNQGIDLTFLRTALVVQFVTELSKMTQFFQRFARNDSAGGLPTRVDMLVTSNDESRLATLRERLDAFNSVFKAARAERLAAGAFVERAMSDDEFQTELNRLMAGVDKRLATSGLISDEEDEDDDD